MTDAVPADRVTEATGRVPLKQFMTLWQGRDRDSCVARNESLSLNIGFGACPGLYALGGLSRPVMSGFQVCGFSGWHCPEGQGVWADPAVDGGFTPPEGARRANRNPLG
jgi:hypothetical protein